MVWMYGASTIGPFIRCGCMLHPCMKWEEIRIGEAEKQDLSKCLKYRSGNEGLNASIYEGAAPVGKGDLLTLKTL